MIGTGSADTIFGFAILISAVGVGKDVILVILSIVGQDYDCIIRFAMIVIRRQIVKPQKLDFVNQYCII